MNVPAEVRDRIISVANRLYEEGGRNSYPTVGAVRSEARVDMNSASEVMKDWRKAQTAAPVAVAVAVPESLNKASTELLANVWTQAQAFDGLALVIAAHEVQTKQTAEAHAEQVQELNSQIDQVEAALHESREAHAGTTAQYDMLRQQ